MRTGRPSPVPSWKTQAPRTQINTIGPTDRCCRAHDVVDVSGKRATSDAGYRIPVGRIVRESWEVVPA